MNKIIETLIGIKEKVSLIVTKSKKNTDEFEKPKYYDFVGYYEELKETIRSLAENDETARKRLDFVEKNKKNIEITYNIVKNNEIYAGGILQEWYKSPSTVLEEIISEKRNDIIGQYLTETEIQGEIYKYIKKPTSIRLCRHLDSEDIENRSFNIKDSEELKVLKIINQMRMVTYSIMDTILNRLKIKQKI